MPAFNSVLNESPQERINSTFQFVQTLAGLLNNWEDRSRLVLLGWAGCGWGPVTRMRPPATPIPLTRRRALRGGVGLLLAHIGQRDAAVAVLPAAGGLGADHPAVLLTRVVRLICGEGRAPAPQQGDSHPDPWSAPQNHLLRQKPEPDGDAQRSAQPSLTGHRRAHASWASYSATSGSPTPPPWPGCWCTGCTGRTGPKGREEAETQSTPWGPAP